MTREWGEAQEKRSSQFRQAGRAGCAADRNEDHIRCRGQDGPGEAQDPRRLESIVGAANGPGMVDRRSILRTEPPERRPRVMVKGAKL